MNEAIMNAVVAALREAFIAGGSSHLPERYADDHAKNAAHALLREIARVQRPVYVIFDGPPSHESGRFVEVENDRRQSLGQKQTGAEWNRRDDGLWRLGPFYPALGADAP